MVTIVKRRVSILGATGSIGLSTLDVIRRHPDRFSVSALTASTRVDSMVELCHEFRPRYAVMADENAAEALSRALSDLPAVLVPVSYTHLTLPTKRIV